MSNLRPFFKTRSISFIIVSSCLGIVLLLVLSITFATLTSFARATREAVTGQTRELSTQITYNYENYINTVIRTSNIIQTDIDRFDLADKQSAAEFSQYLRAITHQKSDIIKIALYNYYSGACMASTDSAELSAGELSSSREWFLAAVADPTVHAFSVPYSADGGSEYRVSISKQISYDNGEKSAVLLIEISFENFIELVEKSNLGTDGNIIIVDGKYSVVYASDSGAELEVEIAAAREIVLGSQNSIIGGHNMAVNVDTLAGTDWRICTFINIDAVVNIERAFLTTVTFVSIIVLIAAAFLFSYVSHTITDPIRELEAAMRRVEKSDYFRQEETEIVGSREVTALTRRFNKMMRKIKELMDRVVAEQNAQRKSELKALQNQINPHFLYNTLDSIVWLIENNKNAEAQEMVVALAKLFRISISKNREAIAVSDELEHVRNYLLIQSIRYADSFDYEFIVDERVLDKTTMKLILQPLVENCIYHGLKNKIDKGHITVTAALRGDTIVLSVADNGYGMRAETIAALYESFKDGAAAEGVGLKNIYTRIKMYYSGRADMHIESELDEGTVITIEEPAT